MQLPVEKESIKLKKKKAKMLKESRAEEADAVKGQHRYDPPTVDEVEKELAVAPDLPTIKQRIAVSEASLSM